MRHLSLDMTWVTDEGGAWACTPAQTMARIATATATDPAVARALLAGDDDTDERSILIFSFRSPVARCAHC